MNRRSKMTYKDIVISDRKWNETVVLPASKSISNRALVISALAGGKILPTNLSDCDDTEVIINALRDNPYTIDIKAAGTAMRFMTAYLSVTPGEHVITGTERMRHRPIGILVEALRHLGADITYVGEEGYPPLLVKGKQLDGGKITIDGSVSSQYISALLMIGPMLKNGLILKLSGKIVSKPYIELTLDVMHHYGADVRWTDVDEIKVSPIPYTPLPYIIENDWSAAAFWYELIAMGNNVGAKILLPGLKSNSSQGDTSVKLLYIMFGVKTTFTKDEVGMETAVLTRQRSIPSRFDIDLNDQPDLAQSLAVTCATLGTPFRFTGLESLRIKETDRITALENELRKMGCVLHDAEDSILYWDGERCDPLPHPAIDTYDDHRMAMAFAPAAVRYGTLRINNPEVVSKSYPHFWQEMEKFTN